MAGIDDRPRRPKSAPSPWWRSGAAERKRRIETIASTQELTRLADRLLAVRSLDDLGI